MSSLEVVKIGTTPDGLDVSMDRNAFESDGVMLCSRVKWHTDFEGKLESGVHKIDFDGKDLASGIYFYRIHAESFLKTKKLMLFK